MPVPTSNPPDRRLLRVRPAARYLGMGEKRIRKLISKGEIPYVQDKPGNSPFLVDIQDLDRWIQARKMQVR